jgi:metal-responsive CopG/Arc/MetJ family transcriptional regulator
MKHHVGLTMDAQLFREIERIRGREKRSTFIEHLIRLGLKAYMKNENLEFPKNISSNQNRCLETV